MSGARHLYVHLPFCAHRCGYCDFVTVVGRRRARAVRRRAARRARARARSCSRPRLETVFLGGGTPTFTRRASSSGCSRRCPRADEVTVEANPETVTPELARRCARDGVNRVSLGAQSFQPHLLDVLERRAGPDDVRRAFYPLRDAGFDNISLDLIYGIPGQSAADLERDLDEALALEPEHLSCYELEAKPGTRFTHAHGDELAAPGRGDGGYFERVVETLTGAGYRWYETANFCRRRAQAGATCARGTTSPTGSGATTSASGSARSRQSAAGAGGTRRASGATSPRSRGASGRRASSSRSATTCAARAADARAAARRAAGARGLERRARRARRSRGWSGSASPSAAARRWR